MSEYEDAPRHATVPAEVVQLLSEQRGLKEGDVFVVGKVPKTRSSDDRDCEGQLFVDFYTDADGLEHIAVSTWYPCDNYLEIEDDSIIL